jgi:hypothetical protein
MLIGHTIAPSYQQLRPMKAPTSPTFPVYRDLPDRMVNATNLPDGTVAHVLGTCAGYAYSDQTVVAMIMARMGLEDNHCLMVAESVDAMFICSTAFLVQSKCGRLLILCYRGTEPSNFINWLTDADVNPQKVSFPFPDLKAPTELHGGFYRNVRATRYAVVTAVQRALNGQSVLESGERMRNGLEALYITGHSLGGAMAALMGVMLSIEPVYRDIAEKLKAVYTFGQPMIGNRAFARECAQNPFVGTKVFRYIFGHDIVPELPPKASGDFAHFGLEYELDRDSHGNSKFNSKSRTQLTHLTELLGAPFGFLAHQLRALRNMPLQHSLYDHGPQHYIAGLTPPDVRTEFGD